MDIVVFGQHDPEEVKAYIANHHHRFSLEEPRTRGATYKKLYFHLHVGLGFRCKVDILVSGLDSPLHIPSIPRLYVEYVDNIPVVPLLVLIILKVQGWDDHCNSRRPHFRAKIPQDIKDINTLLDMADENYDDRYSYGDLPTWFFERAEWLFSYYTNEFPEKAYWFRELGFDTWARESSLSRDVYIELRSIIYADIFQLRTRINSLSPIVCILLHDNYNGL